MGPGVFFLFYVFVTAFCGAYAVGTQDRGRRVVMTFFAIVLGLCSVCLALDYELSHQRFEAAKVSVTSPCK
jgi:hypothetical protein